MTWFKVDDGFYDHPKVANLSLAARGLWVTMGSWCAKHETDGEISERQLRGLGGTRRLIDQLVEARMLERICTESVPNVYRMCSWSEWNPTSRELKAKRDAWRESKSKFREQKRAEQGKRESVQAGHDEVSNGVSNGVSNEVSNGVSRTTVPSRPVPTLKKEGKKETGDTPVGSGGIDSPPSMDVVQVGAAATSGGFAAYGTPDDPRCVKHKDLPREQVPACRDCARAREVFESQVLDAKAARRDAIDACQWCDENGMAWPVNANGDTVAVRCDHVVFPVAPPPPAPFQSWRSKK